MSVITVHGDVQLDMNEFCRKVQYLLWSCPNSCEYSHSTMGYEAAYEAVFIGSTVPSRIFSNILCNCPSAGCISSRSVVINGYECVYMRLRSCSRGWICRYNNVLYNSHTRKSRWEMLRRRI